MDDVELVVSFEVVADDDVVENLVVALIVVGITVAKVIVLDDALHVVAFEGFDNR